MGFFSSIFKSNEVAAQRFAEQCLFLRDEHQFLQNFANTRVHSSSELGRLQFSKDVLLLILAAECITLNLRDDKQLVQTVEHFQGHYLHRVSVSPTSVVGTCLICDEEISAVGEIIAPNAPLSQIRTTLVSTTGLISVVMACRSSEFHREFVRGCLESSSSAAFLPLARTCLWRIRGGSKDDIPFDDVSHFSVAFTAPYLSLHMTAQRLFS